MALAQMAFAAVSCSSLLGVEARLVPPGNCRGHALSGWETS